MKKSIVRITFLSAILGACLALQSCADTETAYGDGPYAYNSGPYVTDTYSQYRYPYSYNTYTTYAPYETTTTYSPYYYDYRPYPPSEPTTTYTTTRTEPDSVVGSTAHAVGTIIAAPFRLVGDVFSILL